MNKIQELAEEALRNSLEHDGVYRAEGYLPSVSKTFTDTFAKLLIKECLTICEDVAEQTEPAIACYYKIKQTFRN